MTALNLEITSHGNLEKDGSIRRLLYLSAAASEGNKNSQFHESEKIADKYYFYLIQGLRGAPNDWSTILKNSSQQFRMGLKPTHIL